MWEICKRQFDCWMSSDMPTYTSYQSSYFAHWRRAHSELRAVQDCEPPSPLLWTCCGCLCWGCWHSDGLAGPPCCGSPPHGDPYTPVTPASWLLADSPSLSLLWLNSPLNKSDENKNTQRRKVWGSSQECVIIQSEGCSKSSRTLQVRQ